MDSSEARLLLGIEIRRQKNGDVFLVQEKYARDVLSRFNMEGCKSCWDMLKSEMLIYAHND